MALVVSGLFNKQVGGELGVSEITVEARRRQVTQKMKVDFLATLVKLLKSSEYLAKILLLSLGNIPSHTKVSNDTFVQ